MSGAKARVDGETGFVLHAYPFRETSLLLEAFTRDHGRLALVARGARRPRSALRGVLMEFQPLELGWFGKAEVRTLAKAEWQGGQPLLHGRALLFGYYLNELLLRLLPRDDPHPALFDAYASALAALAVPAPGEAALRRFERVLLRELGYGLALEEDAASGAPIRPEGRYVWIAERGMVEAPEPLPEGVPAYSGRALRAIAAEDYSDADTLQQAKALMRQVINHTLGGQALNSRRVFMELQEL